MSHAPTKSPRLALAVAMLVSAIIIIQIGAALAKQLFPLISPQGTSSLRLFYAALILSALWQPWTKALSRAQWLATLLYGLSLGGMNLLIYMAFDRLPLGIAIALEFIGPLSVALIASRRPLDFLWVLFAIAGLAMLLPIGGVSSSLDPIGICLALGAGLCWALYILFGQRTSTTVHGGTALAIGMSIGAILVMPFGLAKVGMQLFSPAIFPTALSVAILSSIIPYSLEMRVLNQIPVKLFGILQSLGPALGALAGLILLKEHLNHVQWLAIFCIIAASIGSTLCTANHSAQKETTQ